MTKPADQINDLDLDKKMYEANMEAFQTKLKKIQEEHGVRMRPVMMADAMGIVEPKIMTVPWEKDVS